MNKEQIQKIESTIPLYVILQKKIYFKYKGTHRFILITKISR